MNPLIRGAGINAEDFKTVNQTVAVDGKGQLKGKKVVLFLAPLAKGQRRGVQGNDIPQNNYGPALRASYQAIFKSAKDSGAKSVAIPCFSTGRGRLDRKKTATIAVEEAKKYTDENPEFHVRFVPYSGDRENIQAYHDVFTRQIQREGLDLEHVDIRPGEIQKSNTEAIICPIRERYDVESSGPTTKAVLRAATQRAQKKTLTGVKKPEKEEKIEIGKSTLAVQKGDITETGAEIIVNAANPQLAKGGGVCGAIFKKADPIILELECLHALKKKGVEKLEYGDAVFTGPGKLEETNGTKGIIHAVGPDMRDYEVKSKDPENKLASAYRNALEIAKEKGVKSIAFPSISTGIYNYPLDDAARVAAKTIHTFLNENPDLELEVRLVAFTDKDFKAYQSNFFQSEEPEVQRPASENEEKFGAEMKPEDVEAKIKKDIIPGLSKPPDGEKIDGYDPHDEL